VIAISQGRGPLIITPVPAERLSLSASDICNSARSHDDVMNVVASLIDVEGSITSVNKCLQILALQKAKPGEVYRTSYQYQ
jgi:hypothetical protein